MTLTDRLLAKARIADADGDEYDCAATMREAAAELERCHQDAERYRWLRDRARPDSPDGICVGSREARPNGWDWVHHGGELLDRELDGLRAICAPQEATSQLEAAGLAKPAPVGFGDAR